MTKKLLHDRLTNDTVEGVEDDRVGYTGLCPEAIGWQGEVQAPQPLSVWKQWWRQGSNAA